MSNSLISVIIPAYNCSKLIPNAIESVLGQTYSNLELIVVDDGSTDNTAEIILNYKNYNNNMKYIYQNNGGVSKARNTGIKQSVGEYIAFLDADDIWDKNKLEIQMKVINNCKNIDMIFSSFKNTKNNKIVVNKSYKNTFNFFKEYKYDMKKVFDSKSSLKFENDVIEYYYGNIYKYLFLGNFILPSSVLIRKMSLVEVGILNEEYKVAEETEFFLRYSKSNIVGFIEYPLLNYEMPAPENLSGKKNTEKLIKNALKIQIDSIIANQEIYQKDSGFFKRGLSMTYCRLAYYYLSEYKNNESKQYAIYSMKAYKFNFKSYIILLMSLMPKNTLQYIARMKQMQRNQSS
jgi:glycosyltransferase involved in cell wall biosynthesis